MGLRTITSAHKDLQKVLMVITFLTAPIDEDFDEDVYAQWADLNHTLVQLWRSYSIRTTLIYSTGNDCDVEEREFIETLLPEAIGGGAVKLVDA